MWRFWKDLNNQPTAFFNPGHFRFKKGVESLKESERFSNGTQHVGPLLGIIKSACHVHLARVLLCLILAGGSGAEVVCERVQTPELPSTSP